MIGYRKARKAKDMENLGGLGVKDAALIAIAMNE